MLIIREGSLIVGIPRGPNVSIVSRIKLSEICNINQSLLPFKFLKGRIYAKKGEKTVQLKSSKSRHDKRMCTL
jgi:hypothetical protein